MDRRNFLKLTAYGAGAVAVPMLAPFGAPQAAGRADTLLVVVGSTVNSMDIHRAGTNRPSYAIAVNLYDRLVGFGTKTLADGTEMYDYQNLTPELAESWAFAADGTSVTFKLKPDAVFWDGSPVTAEDVKWSFDRAVSVGGFPTTQMRAGLLEKPEQFTAVDEKTFRIDFLRPSKLTMPDLAVPVPIIINSKVAKANATQDDPWATEYLHRNPAGSGAFMLERWDPGQQVVYKRFDDWKCGPLPGVERVIMREIPSSSTRRALLERGDADISLDLPPKDFAELMASGRYTVAAAPIENSMIAIGLDTTYGPFQDKRVRQAVAYAIPYEQIFKQAAFERGIPMWGGASFEPADISWPQPFPYSTDYDKAKALLAEAGYADGFEVPFAFNLGFAQWSEPMALLVQEGLGKVGIRTAVEKVPGANWRTQVLIEKKWPMHIKNFGGWLNYPDYYAFWVYQDGRLFNSMKYRNETVETVTEEALHLPVEHPDYAPKIKQLIATFFDEVPLIPVFQPYLDVAMQPNVSGYKFYFHRQLDARWLSKA
ncbi:ABC transporter substrate-binding protein [Minwuia thermotolerans]|uniref:ABC transporter substrate-binding protein n=1 Tax=Minwuia thermotolerans TaxID=2056226 RepID=A0A2M9G3D6_9PROT|nr:ABC transporter substrate-binding protein [Minwuia thermotolerans]PJK30223.1 ABC transporter substrate-binding protein [Minwuia thermotolerans]